MALARQPAMKKTASLEPQLAMKTAALVLVLVLVPATEATLPQHLEDQEDVHLELPCVLHHALICSSMSRSKLTWASASDSVQVCSSIVLTPAAPAQNLAHSICHPSQHPDALASVAPSVTLAPAAAEAVVAAVAAAVVLHHHRVKTCFLNSLHLAVEMAAAAAAAVAVAVVAHHHHAKNDFESSSNLMAWKKAADHVLA